jgi:L-glyceraldehyde 3-phosphate reductase
VDIFYSHRPDPYTPLEETMGALHSAVQQGKALYVGISQYKSEQTREATRILRDMGTPCLIHQPRYHMLDRWIEEDRLLDTLEEAGMGAIVFSPLAQGVLTSKYLDGLPADSRAVRDGRYLKADQIDPVSLEKARQLNAIARDRGQTLAQIAVAWLLIDPRVTSVLIGASKVEQVDDIVGALPRLDFSDDEKRAIRAIIEA